MKKVLFNIIIPILIGAAKITVFTNINITAIKTKLLTKRTLDFFKYVLILFPPFNLIFVCYYLCYYLKKALIHLPPPLFIK